MSTQGQWQVRSEDGTDYRVGLWIFGEWHPGSREDAVREARGLRGLTAEPDREPTAYAWRLTRRKRPIR